MNTPFHLAIGVNNLEEARKFYRDLLGAEEGRSSASWVDFNFFGHQLTCHLINNSPSIFIYSNQVDNKTVPIPHFGVILSLQEFALLEDRLKQYDTVFFIEPHTRFKNRSEEQKTMFFKDPFGYFIEIKSFTKKKEY